MGWQQGEHVGAIGPTGQGKTTLLTYLLPLRQYVVIFATKPKDQTMDELIETGGYTKISKWQPKWQMPASRTPKRVLWPNASRLGSKLARRKIFADALEQIYVEGGWTVVFDEGYYIANTLKLGPEVKEYLLQGRSLHITVVFATQRPAWVPVEVFDQSTHLFFWRDNDERNLRKIGGIGFLSADFIRHTVARLEQNQFLYMNTRTGQMCRSRTPDPNMVWEEETA